MNTKKKFSERFIAFFLSFIMIFTLIPTEIFAAVVVQFGPESGNFNVWGQDGSIRIRTTFSDGGYGTVFKVDGTTTNLSKCSPATLNGCTITTTLTSISNGRYVKIEYNVTNNSSTSHVIGIATHADTQINQNDRATISRIPDGRGIQMSDGTYTFYLLLSNSYGVTNVDNVWYGQYSNRSSHHWDNTIMTGTVSGIDSGLTFGWDNRTIAPGQTLTLSAVNGIGTLNSPPTLNAQIQNPQGSYLPNDRVSFSGTVSDPDGDRMNIKWSLDNGAENTLSGTYTSGQSFSQTITLPSVLSPGQHKLQIWAMDSEGNMSMAKELSFNVINDTTPPVVSHSISPSTITKGQVTINLTANDSLSKIYSVQYPDGRIQTYNTSSSLQTTYSVSQNGTYVFIVKDSFSNENRYSVSITNIDNVAPTLNLSYTPGWHKNDFNVRVTASDALSGLGTITYTTNEVTPQSGAVSSGGNITMRNNGEYILTVTANDKVGNKISKTADIKIDKISPVITSYTITDANNSLKNFNINSNITTNCNLRILLNVNDIHSHFKYLEYQLPGSSTWERMPDLQSYFDITKDINGVVKVRVYDGAGNVSNILETKNILLDRTPPEIKITPENADWATSHNVEIIATDMQSNLDEIYYFTSNSSTPPQSGWNLLEDYQDNTSTKKSSLTIDSPDASYLHIKVTDKAGNTSIISKGKYMIDNIKPVVNFVKIEDLSDLVPQTNFVSLMSISNVNHTTNKQVQITVEGLDANSGINRILYKLNTSETWYEASKSSGNNYIFRIETTYHGDILVKAYDNAGNESEELVLKNITLINHPPEITIQDNSDWQTGTPVRIPVEIVTDSRLEISSATFSTNEDVPVSGDLTYVNGTQYTVDLLNEGVYSFSVEAINNAGSIGYANSTIVRIDRTPPIIEDYEVVLTSVLPSVNPFSLQNDIITNRGLKIDFDISDNLSGFDHLEYELPGDALPRIVPAGQTYFTVDEAINGNILVRAYDVAGNVSLTTTISNIIVDNVKPSIDIGNIPTWSNEDITIDVDVSDETLLDKVAWFTTESPDTPTAQGMTYSPATLFPGTVTLSNEGIYTLVVSAYDKAGNISKVESETIRIDKTPPEIIDLEFYMPQTETLNDEELKEENTTPSQNPPLDNPPENEIDNENNSVDSNPPIITDDVQQDEGENSTPAPPVNNNNDNDEQVEDTEEDTKEDAETTEDTNDNLVNESDDNVSFVLTIKHVTEDGTPIANEGAVIVKILDANSEYTSSPINVKGYTFKEMAEESAPVNGIMDSNKTIIYVYTLETVESDENENIEDEITQISQAAIPLSFVEDNIFGSNILVQIFPRDILGYANSGVDKVWYKIESDDGLTTTDWTIVSPDSKGYYFFTINKDFTGTVFARCSDIAGNMSDEYSEHIILDMTSPDPTLILNVNSTDWGLVPGEVDIQAADVNGLDSVYVEIETIEGDTIHEPFELVTMDGQKTLNESFTIHEDGVYEITVTARDIAGNSATKTKTIHIDRTAPEIHDVVFSIVDDDNQVIEYDANVTNKKLLVEVDLSDNMSGFDYMEYQTMDSPTWNRVAQGIDEFYVATAYKGNIKVRIYDKAGNVSTVFVSDEITVETDDPTLIVSKDEAWTPTGVTLHVDANDPMSGIKNVVYSYTAADGVPVTGQCDMIGDKVNTDVFFDKHGSYTITFTATDNAGNTSSVTRRVNIDRTTQFPAPDIDSHGYISGTWSDKAINVTLGYNDQSVVPISGIKKYQYKDIDTDQWIDGVPELDGYLDNSYVFRAISTVGCISDETIVFSAKIDKVAPVIVGEDVGGESSNEPLKIVVSIIEEESGIKIVEASFDGNTWFEIHANSDGNYVVDLGNEYIGDVYIKATDICGNVSDTYVVNDLVIDFERPRLVLSENSDVKDVIILKATENIKKGREGYVRIYDTKELDYIAPIAELHISNNRIKVEGEYVYINMVGLVDGQRQYAVEVDEGFVWDLANNLCYPMELSYLGTSDTKVPSLQNVIVTNPSNNESYPAVFDETKNEYNVIIPTDIVGQIIITPIFDMEIPELWATSNDIQIDYVGREDIGITIDDDYAWPVSIDIKALSKTTTVNIYRGNIEVDINTDEDIRIDEMDVLRAVDIVPFLEDGVVYTLVVNAEENYSNESDETKAYNFISTTDNFVDLSSGFNIEIWLYETKDGKTDEGRIINELQNGLEVTLTIPDDMMDRDAYGIVRVHNGKAEMLRSTVNYNKITFNSDKFSSYYIAVGETVQVEVPETIIRDWGDGVPNDTYCIVPSLIGNDSIISRFSYVDENDVMNFIKPIAGNYHLTQNHKVFPDVTWNTYQWAYESIHALAARGLVAGFDDGRFGPGETITRAQLVTILARLENLPMDYTKSSFTDVDENDWFFQYVEAAYDAGLIAGIGNKQFAPNRYITRQELATILYRYMEYKGKNPDITMNKVFTDQNSISYWASNAVNAVANAGIIAGYDNGAFGPMNNATRAEASTMIWRFIRYIVDNSKDVYELTSYSEVIDE